MTNNNNHHGTAVVTDNARNMEAAVREAGLSSYSVFCTHFKPCVTSGSEHRPHSSTATHAENIVRLLTPLKKATTVLCDDSRPIVYLIVPLKHVIEQSMAQCDEDSTTIAQMKRAILKDLTDQNQGEQNKFLLESTM